MNDQTHSLLGTQRLVRAIRKVATSVARSEIATAHQLATVSATSPFTVTIDGSSTAVAAHYLKSYAPTANDRVVCELYGKQILVLGTFV